MYQNLRAQALGGFLRARRYYFQ